MKTLKDYIKIFQNKDTSTIAEIAEASAYFVTLGSEFSARGKELKKMLEAKTGADLLSETGVDSYTVEVNEDSYVLKESTTTKVEIDDKALLEVSNLLSANWFETKRVINKDAIVADYESGNIPLIAKPHIHIYESKVLAMKKKPRKKVK